MIESGNVHDGAELRRLIAENPDLPIVVLASDSANIGDYRWMYCTVVKCEVGEILDYTVPCNDMIIYSDRDDFRSDMEDYLSDLPDMSLLTTEEFNQTLEAEITKYDPYWKKVIVIRADN